MVRKPCIALVGEMKGKGVDKGPGGCWAWLKARQSVAETTQPVAITKSRATSKLKRLKRRPVWLLKKCSHHIGFETFCFFWKTVSKNWQVETNPKLNRVTSQLRYAIQGCQTLFRSSWSRRSRNEAGKEQNPTNNQVLQINSSSWPWYCHVIQTVSFLASRS